MAAEACFAHGREAKLVRLVQIGTVLERHGGNIEVVVVAGPHQRRVAALVDLIDILALSDQAPHLGGVATPGRNDQ